MITTCCCAQQLNMFLNISGGGALAWMPPWLRAYTKQWFMLKISSASSSYSRKIS